MSRHSLQAAILAGVALLATPIADAADINITPSSAIGATSVSMGHNLPDARRAADTDANPRLKRLDHTTPATKAKASRGISVNGPKAMCRAVGIDPSSALMFESFESCAHMSDALPEGWTSQSKGATALGTKEHWIGISKNYANYYMFAPPADGNMMLGMFYNDDYHKDEWLISPEITIPSADYSLSFYWYTIPYYLYVIDRSHVDFEEGTFTNREMLYNFEVLAKVGDGEWTQIYDFEKQFADLEYAELSQLDYDVMQLSTVSLEQYAGHTVQLAFRYAGKGGNSFFLDAVCVSNPHAEAHYTPDYSRLFYGISPDEEMWWLPASVEFYPVNKPISWHNSSPVTDDIAFSWLYYTLDDEGKLAERTSTDQERLQVTYTPDYTSEATLRNNFYPMPVLKAKSPEGGVGSYTSPANFLQAGGTTEFDAGEDNGGYTKYTAMNFDILTEGLGIHYEGDEELGFFAEPIFGHSVNTDAWWEHHSFPDGVSEGKYSYVDGFANMYFPHDEAPMVVKGVTAVAMGTIYPEAQFTAKIYTMTEDGYLVETPIAQKTILGSDVIAVNSGLTQKYLVLNFELDEPVLFTREGTGYAYFVEICGYRDDKIEYFAPLQSMVPNEYEWALGFYHCYASFNTNLTDEMGYVCFFTDDNGDDLYTAFAIGLDAHYPWLELDGKESDVIISESAPSFGIRGYYDADDYKVEAPEWLDVTLAGRYLTEVTVRPLTSSDSDREAPITISAPGVSLTVNAIVKGGYDGVSDIIAGAASRANVYNTQGILLKSNATAEDIRTLPAGIYFYGGKKIVVR